jgi:hypothetical protein
MIAAVGRFSTKINARRDFHQLAPTQRPSNCEPSVNFSACREATWSVSRIYKRQVASRSGRIIAGATAVILIRISRLGERTFIFSLEPPARAVPHSSAPDSCVAAAIARDERKTHGNDDLPARNRNI